MLETGYSIGEAAGLLAALIHVVGYVVYISNFLKASIRPNAASWLMFAYGTELLLVLEWVNGADWPVLALPAACTAMSIFVGFMCLRKNATEPVMRWERNVFFGDIALTIVFFGMSLMSFRTPQISVLLLILGNVTTFTAFVPILFSTWRSPDRERPLPWVLWSVAYCMLFFATLWDDRGANPQLLIYPAISLFLHASIAVFAIIPLLSKKRFFDRHRRLYIARSNIEGSGIFANRNFAIGDPICLLRGRPRHGPVASDVGANWIGIAPDLWIDPDLPLDHINHSCAANAAFGAGYILKALKPIERGEEVTLDYSTTEADAGWSMACSCGDTTCRQTLYPIQIAFADSHFPPQAAPRMQNVWRLEHEAFKRGKGKLARPKGRK